MCAVYTDKSYQTQLLYAKYYILIYRDKLLVTNTDKYIAISASTTINVIYIVTTHFYIRTIAASYLLTIMVT